MRVARAAALALAGSAPVVALVVRRRRAARSEHVDLYFDDGSIVSLPDGSPEAARLLPLARDVLRTARA